MAETSDVEISHLSAPAIEFAKMMAKPLKWSTIDYQLASHLHLPGPEQGWKIFSSSIHLTSLVLVSYMAYYVIACGESRNGTTFLLHKFKDSLFRQLSYLPAVMLTSSRLSRLHLVLCTASISHKVRFRYTSSLDSCFICRRVLRIGDLHENHRNFSLIR